jgi:hypothetical protein
MRYKLRLGTIEAQALIYSRNVNAAAQRESCPALAGDRTRLCQPSVKTLGLAIYAVKHFAFGLAAESDDFR